MTTIPEYGDSEPHEDDYEDEDAREPADIPDERITFIRSGWRIAAGHDTRARLTPLPAWWYRSADEDE